MRSLQMPVAVALVAAMLTLSTGTGCSPRRGAPEKMGIDAATLVSSDGSVTFSRVAEGIWVHTTNRALDGVKTPLNGLLIVTKVLGDVTELTNGETGIDVFFPGPGHTADNMVVWLPGEKILW